MDQVSDIILNTIVYSHTEKKKDKTKTYNGFKFIKYHSLENRAVWATCLLMLGDMLLAFHF